MNVRGILTAASLLLFAGLGADALAQVRIEGPRVDIDIPDRRPDPSTGAEMVELVGGLFALRDGYDRSRRGLLCVLTYEDRNGNGQRDRGEGPLPGWTLAIADGKGATVAQGRSDKDGRFCNSQPLTPGLYSVRQTPGGGWTNTEPGAPMPDFKPVTLPPDKGITVLFGNCRGEGCARPRRDKPSGEARPGPGDPTPQSTGKICVEKYNDLNVNGVRDAGEPLLPGWHFTVWHYTSGNVDQGTTGADGRWCSALDYAPLTYKVIETSQPGWHNTDPVGLAMKWVPVWSGQTTTIQFGNRYLEPGPPPLPIQLCVEKFNDLNGDGVRQANEPGVPGFHFAIIPPGLGLLGLTSVGPTSNDGTACMSIAVGFNGVYGMTEGFWNYFYPGWTATTPGGESQEFYAAQGQTVTRVFGNRQITPQTGEICVTKYEDLDGDGTRDPGEPPLAGWTFGLSNGLSGVTGANGRICWNNVPVGGYTVLEMLQPGWESTDPGGANPAKAVAIAAGETAKPMFGNRRLPPQTGRVCIVKYNDANGNGARDPGEAPMGGWSFMVSDSGGAPVATGSTARDGSICRDLPGGTYTAGETMQAGWTNTDPAGPSPQKPFTITPGQTTNLAFGNQRTPPQPQFSVEKFDDSASAACGPNGVNNPCVFRIRITNTGTTPYAGTASFSDSMRVLTLPPAANSMVLVSVGTAGWSCSATGAPMTCTGPVNLPAGQSVDVLVTFNFSHPVKPTRNCVTLTAPAALPEVCLTL